MFDKIIAHTSFIGETGYANHSRNFFTALNKIIPVKVRNFTVGNTWSGLNNGEPHNNEWYLTDDHKEMLYKQTCMDGSQRTDHYIYGGSDEVEKGNNLHIVLNEVNHYYFYDEYDGPKIAYNVWESTLYPDEFFNRLLGFDQLWVPSKWQKDCSVDQGYSKDKIRIVPEPINANIFFPENISKENSLDEYKDSRFKFLLFGRWDYRKSTTEIIKSFLKTFGKDEPVDLVVSIDNSFSIDDIKTTEDRLKHYGFDDERIKIKHFPSREDYIKYLKTGHVFLSCARSEGWNLPLIESMACGTPSIYSNWGAQLEFAEGKGIPINVIGEEPASSACFLENIPGNYCQPDFDHLSEMMRDTYTNYTKYKEKAIAESSEIISKFRWGSAVYKAVNAFNSLGKKDNDEKIVVDDNILKLNLGCGNDIKKGYVNIDKYNNTGKVDLSCDIVDLPYEDNTVDEIFLSHVLEHFPVRDIPSILKEWHRVLKVLGIIDIRVPNLEECVNTWLNTPDDKKYYSLEHIFGSQSHEGNFHFSGFNEKSLCRVLEDNGFHVVESCFQPAYGGSINEVRVVAKKIEFPYFKNTQCNCNFVDGAFLELLGKDKRDYLFEFNDLDNNSMVHSAWLKPGSWTRPHRRYFTNWGLEIKLYGDVIFEHKFSPQGKNILISLDSKSLGDTIAWMPYAEEFRKKHKCNVSVSTFWNNLFKEQYSDLKFINPGTVLDNLYASYNVGWFFPYDQNKNPNDFRNIPLQQTASDVLGLDYEEIKPKITIPEKTRRIKDKYVCIGIHSTAQCKYWNYPNGWQIVTDYLNEKGYNVVHISKEQGEYMGNSPPSGVFDKTGGIPIDDRIVDLKHADMFIGISSGLSWLSWAVGTPTIIISGVTNPFNEPVDGIERVFNSSVCNSCFNDSDIQFDPGDWKWCPRSKDFECSKKITPEMVIERIDKIIEDKNA